MAARMLRNTAIGREQRKLRRPLCIIVARLAAPAPGLALAVDHLSEIQYRPLHHLAAGAALVLDDAPIAMLLAVLDPSIGPQEHDRRADYSTHVGQERD